MKNLFKLKTLSLLAFVFLVSTAAMAQEKKPLASPRDSVSGKIAGSDVKIWYGSPSVKGRTIFGGLEPWGKVYRAGANEATTFTTDKGILVEGQALPAGTYGFFVIPEKSGQWTVIFNKVAKQWGAFKYDQSQDQLRVTVKTKMIPLQERLVYKVTSTGFSMNWDKTSVPVSVKPNPAM